VVGFFILWWGAHLGLIPAVYVAAFFMALVVSWSIINTLPAMFLGAPDESAMFVVLPGQKYMLQGKGYEAAVLTGIGGIAGIVALWVLFPFSFHLLKYVKNLISPHLFWILGLIIVYIIASEWPKATLRAKTALGRTLEGLKSCGAGFLTLILAGVLGLMVMNRTLLPVEKAFQSLMPAFVGLFAVPWVITNIISKTEIPKQYIGNSVDVSFSHIIKGTVAGVLGGGFAALMPGVTGGVGGLLSGHALAQRDERIFVLSQGVSKTIYYVGAFLFFFIVPLNHLTRGGLAWMLKPYYTAYTIADYWRIMAVMAISGGLSFLLLLPLSRFMIKLVTKINYRSVSIITTFILFAIVFAMAGWMGLLIMLVATCIGLIPVLWHSRRMNCLGILLIPMFLNMAGLGVPVLQFLKII
jgi:putative membrane protein